MRHYSGPEIIVEAYRFKGVNHDYMVRNNSDIIYNSRLQNDGLHGPCEHYDRKTNSYIYEYYLDNKQEGLEIQVDCRSLLFTCYVNNKKHGVCQKTFIHQPKELIFSYYLDDLPVDEVTYKNARDHIIYTMWQILISEIHLIIVDYLLPLSIDPKSYMKLLNKLPT